jgi:hypothetical protein
MPEFYSLRLALSQEIDRLHVHERDLIEVKRDGWSAVFNQRFELPKMLRAHTANEPNRGVLSVKNSFDP